jgi:hypothetical protein
MSHGEDTFWALIVDMSPLLFLLAFIALVGWIFSKTTSSETKRSRGAELVRPGQALPLSVQCVAWFLIVTGTLELVHALVGAFYTWGHPGKGAIIGGTNAMTILAGLGLLRGSAVWRKIVLFICIVTFVMVPIFAVTAVFGWTVNVSFLGWPVNFHDAPVATTLICLVQLAFVTYAYRILTAPAVWACFESETKESSVGTCAAGDLPR